MHHLTQEETDILIGIIKNMTEGEFLGKEEECEMFKRHLGEFCFIFGKGIDLGKSQLQLQPPVTKFDEIIRKQDLEDLNNIESLRHSHTPRTFCEMVVQMAVNETITPSRAAELLTQPPVISAPDFLKEIEDALRFSLNINTTNANTYESHIKQAVGLLYAIFNKQFSQRQGQKTNPTKL